MTWQTSLAIGARRVAPDAPTYFIADIASSHDGDLGRAKALIHLAKAAGADCAKFQHFLAKDIVSDSGFRALGGPLSHQASWSKSVYDTFAQYETPRDWTPILAEECVKAGIDFMTTPYDEAAVALVDPHVKAWKIGSGDIGWTDQIARVAARGKPVFLATGAADMDDVARAVAAALAVNPALCLMQCNTNYTGSAENFACLNLNVLKSFAVKWPGLPLGLSDHTPGHAAVLGAIALGARAVEKHFTDDNTREGPDHRFSMNPQTWREMVDRARELEVALGDGVKRVEANERDAAVVQRRSLCVAKPLAEGHILKLDDLVALRPRPEGAVEPYERDLVVGRTLLTRKAEGEALLWEDVGAPALARGAGL